MPRWRLHAPQRNGFGLCPVSTPLDVCVDRPRGSNSPCPKLKPVSKSSKCGYIQVATQPYGGGLWHTWFDRDLGIAGRVIVRRGPGRYSHDLVRGWVGEIVVHGVESAGCGEGVGF